MYFCVATSVRGWLGKARSEAESSTMTTIGSLGKTGGTRSGFPASATTNNGNLIGSGPYNIEKQVVAQKKDPRAKKESAEK